MFQDTLKHEKEVTAMIGNLAAIAAEDKDYASSNMLVWFIDEQVEEEASARDMITACEAVEGNKFGLLHARQGAGRPRLHAGFAAGQRIDGRFCHSYF